MTFDVVNKLAFAITAALCLVLLFFPAPIYWLFSIDASASADFIARRAAMLFAGFSVLALVTSDTESDEVRQVVSLAFAVSMAGLMILGLFELFRGVAGLGIMLAVAVEAFFAFYYIRFWRD
ncbi:hypothetical protein [Litoreibacter janthinus]|uniref:DUF4345 domain-containing protein n=1 Tax=Litoreibacter janthinus TaxID=670154 RepID=A0A1I6H163_9RHOB|nr:hypothetical protein [Litoreibacter janthinus]SFR48178.1 hypothetical protein SAMN04488002_2300 [Litoreibacter janthinus]